MPSPPTLSNAPPDRRRCLAPVLAAVLTALIYVISLNGTFIYDDAWVAKGDPRLHDVHLWGKYLTDGYNNGVDNLYRPLVSISYALQWQFGAGRPALFHLVNLLLAMLDSALVAALAQRFARWRKDSSAFAAGLIAGLFFAALPLHVEAVAYISGRCELLSTAGVLGALLLFCNRPLNFARVIGIAICCAVATLSKEQGLLILPMLIVAAWCTRLSEQSPIEPQPHDRKSLVDRIIAAMIPGRTPAAPNERAALLLMLILLCWGLAAYVHFRDAHLKFYWDRVFLDWSIQPMIRSVGIDRILMPLVLIGRYAALFLWPARLSPDYGSDVIGWHVRYNEPYVYLGAIGILIWLLATLRALSRRDGATLLCLVGVAVFYGMIGNIVLLIGTNFGERLVYLPTAFALIAIALGIARWLNRSDPVLRHLAWVFLILIVAAMSVRSFAYARRWNDAISFYRWAAAEQPKSVRLHMLVASYYQQHDQLDLAAQAAARGRESLPDYNGIWLQSGQIEELLGHFDQAQQFYETAMKIQPSPKAEQYLNQLAARREAAQTVHRAATRPSTSR